MIKTIPRMRPILFKYPYLVYIILGVIHTTDLLCQAKYGSINTSSSTTTASVHGPIPVTNSPEEVTDNNGADNLARASMNVLSANLRQALADDDGVSAFTYVIPCSSDALVTVMDTNEAMFAARAFSKDGQIDLAWRIVQSVFLAQGSNGFIPRYIYFDRDNSTIDQQWIEGTEYPNYPIFGDPPSEYKPVSVENDEYVVRGSGMLSASPFISSIVMDIFYLSNQTDNDEDNLKDMFDFLYKWHDYLHSKRLEKGYTLIHPWESLIQLDSPIWDEALKDAKEAVQETNYERSDIPNEVKTADDYPGEETYTAMLFLIDCLGSQINDLNSDSSYNKICPFAMIDVGQMSMLYQADIDLFSMADMINDINSKTVISSSKSSQVNTWINNAQRQLEDLWRYDSSMYSYLPNFLDEVGAIRVIRTPIHDNFMPLWRGWDRFLLAQNPDEEPYSGEFRDIDGGKRLDYLTFQMIQGKDSKSVYSFGCDSSFSLRSFGCLIDEEYQYTPIISPSLNYFLSRGLEVNGAIGVGHFLRNTTLNLICGLTPNSDANNIDDCPIDINFSNRYNSITGEARTSTNDFTCSVTSSSAAAVSYDLLFADIPFIYDEGIPIASVWVTVLIAAELIIALVIMLSCVMLSVNLMRGLKYDDDEMMLRMMQDWRFQDRWGMRHEDASLIYGSEFDNGVFDSSQRRLNGDTLLDTSNSPNPPSHEEDENADSWRQMMKTYILYINPFGQSDLHARNRNDSSPIV